MSALTTILNNSKSVSQRSLRGYLMIKQLCLKDNFT
nr:MAG TPA: hypothetical protein [Caudoviricetes sp.]